MFFTRHSKRMRGVFWTGEERIDHAYQLLSVEDVMWQGVCEIVVGDSLMEASRPLDGRAKGERKRKRAIGEMA